IRRSKTTQRRHLRLQRRQCRSSTVPRSPRSRLYPRRAALPAVPAQQRPGRGVRLHEAVERRWREAVALAAGQITGRHERRRFGGGNARDQENYGDAAQPAHGRFRLRRVALPADRIDYADVTAPATSLGTKQPTRQGAMTSTSRSTPLTTRNSLSKVLLSLRAIARYSPSARITRGKAPIDSLTTSPPGVSTDHWVSARASPPRSFTSLRVMIAAR